MPQNKETGAGGDAFGRYTARWIAQALGATMLGAHSNEAILDGKKIVIKCAEKKTRSVGVTYTMLERLDEVVGGFERDDGSFEILSLPASTYRDYMRETRSQGASAGLVGIVAKNVFSHKGRQICVVTLEAQGRISENAPTKASMQGLEL